MKKTCATCGKTKPTTEFHKDRSKPDGLNAYCKLCTIAKQKTNLAKPPRRAAPEGMKWCGRCKQHKTPDQFHNRTGTFDGLDKRCKQCAYELHDEWRRKNLPKTREASRKWRSENPRLAKDYKLRSNYGIPLGTYDKMLTEQGGRCAICGATDPGGAGDFHVDHCHDRGNVRGLLCHNCNIGIGHFKHDQSLLLKAISYLAKSG